jgi:hypothetical protein
MLLNRRLATAALPVLHLVIPIVSELDTMLRNLQEHFGEVAGDEGKKLMDKITRREKTRVTIENTTEISTS